MHFQQFVQFVKYFGSFNHVRSGTTPSRRVKAKEGPALPVSTAPGKESWAHVEQSHGKHFIPVKSLLESCVIKASFAFEPVHIKDNLA